MDAGLLRALDATATLAAQHPERARLTIAADCELVDGTRVEVRTDRRCVVVDTARRLGGTGRAPSPVHHALVALGSCVALSYRTWSAKLGIAFDQLEVEVHADIDSRGALGLDPEVHPGFDGVRVTVHVAGPEAPARYADLHEAAVVHSPVYDVFTRPVPVTARLDRSG